jgi:hypothetical protein
VPHSIASMMYSFLFASLDQSQVNTKLKRPKKQT